MLIATSLSVWIIWFVIASLLALVNKKLVIPAAIIFGIGLALGWW